MVARTRTAHSAVAVGLGVGLAVAVAIGLSVALGVGLGLAVVVHAERRSATARRRIPSNTPVRGYALVCRSSVRKERALAVCPPELSRERSN